MIRMTDATLLIALFITAAGCSQQTAEGDTAQTSKRPKIDFSQYILAEEPEGAVGVIAAREDFRDQQEIVMVGRIGGRKNPWIEGRSAFMVIDASMSVADDGAECCANGECGARQICMEDCCAALRSECTTLVKLVDDRGRVLEIDARELLKARENDLVVVQGRVKRNDEGGFSIVASGVHVRK